MFRFEDAMDKNESKLFDNPCFITNAHLWQMFAIAYHKVHNKKPDEMTWSELKVAEWISARAKGVSDYGEVLLDVSKVN